MTTKKAVNEARIAANKYAAWLKGVRTLIGHIFARMDGVAAEAAYAAGTSYQDYAAKLAASEPVGAALHQRKADAVSYAENRAFRQVEEAMVELEAAGWDLNVLAPYPDSRRVSREKYLSMRDRHNYFAMLTEADPTAGNTHRVGAPNIRRRNERGELRFIQKAKDSAAFQYDKFICKMVAKIGSGAINAKIEGNHIWGNSVLTVWMADHSIQRWHTKQIWNVSCLGKDFPQWPSRLQK